MNCRYFTVSARLQNYQGKTFGGIDVGKFVRAGAGRECILAEDIF